MPFRAALIDMDGTIWETPVRMTAVREELGLPPDGRTILAGIADLPPSRRTEAVEVLRAREREGVERGCLRAGTRELLDFLRLSGVKTILVTNNSRESTDAVLARHELPFDLVVTRDDGPLKPDPGAFLGPLARLGLSPEEALVLGDSHFDLQAAVAAGIPAVVLVAPREWMRTYFPPGAAYHEVPDLDAAREVVRRLLAAK
ncbi:MAG TPA: HAD-IA family hydrolase [Candidatus Bipolaricaulis sp.]|nr:HAD-IA family hydrolase [Candidatus Bipolaricaulis sp.]HPD06685.1 HAD-IA family hydrolase [Candidatus Bipolaricaulis sp.]HRS13524.1 HAD-IA family hydrolase [Candidatus Bipolaricaulis sp.]HRU22046.1 HAD-IA family hydrolase [Candidatus Bipolaricaulis sp.]